MADRKRYFFCVCVCVCVCVFVGGSRVNSIDDGIIEEE